MIVLTLSVNGSAKVNIITTATLGLQELVIQFAV